MKIQDIFTNNNKEISFYIWDSFKDYFYDMELVVSDRKLYSKKLERSMLDSEIIEKWQPEDITLGDLLNWIKTVGVKKGWYFAYVKDKGGVRRAVGWDWDGDGWHVGADEVPSSDGWSDGGGFVSRKPFDSSDSSDSLTFSSSEKEILKQAVEIINRIL